MAAWIDLSDIESAIVEETEAIEKMVTLASKKISLELLTTLVMSSAVDTGRLRAGWLVSVGEVSAAEPAEGVYAAYGGSKGGGTDTEKIASTGGGAASAAMSAQSGEFAKIKPFVTVHVQNNVEYVKYVNDGHPVIAGFVDTAFENVVRLNGGS